MKVIITGATGMIGLHLVKECLNNHDDVSVIIRKNSLKEKLLPLGIKVIHADLDELKDLNIEEKYDIFYHLAWDKTIGEGRNDVLGQTNNVINTLEAIKLAKRIGCKKFVGVGSQAEYGMASGNLYENTPINPTNGYGIAKYCAGKMGKILAQQLDIEFNWVRVLSIYGPYDNPNTLVMHIINSFVKKEKPVLTKGEQMWDYLYVKDAVKALYIIGNRGTNGKTYVLGSGETKPLYEYIAIINQNLGIDEKTGLGLKEYPMNQIMYLCADIDDLKKIGFEPKYSFLKGIKETIEWVMKK